jgi:hypothetical protein
VNEAVALADPDDDEQLDEVEPAGGSFFAAHDPFVDDVDDVLRADDAAAERVWRMFVRDSNAHGFDARSRKSRAASDALRAQYADGRRVRRSPNGRIKMALKEAVTAAHAALTKKLGRAPSVREVFDVVGGDDKIQNVRNILTRSGLAVTKTKGAGAEKVAKVPRNALVKLKAGPPADLVVPGLAAKQKPERPAKPAAASAVLAALYAEMKSLEAQLAKVRKCLDLLESP